MRKTTIYKKWGVIAAALLTILVPLTMKAQDKVEVSLGADVINKYVWRGQDQASGASIQPTLGFAYKGLSLSAWGSSSLSELDPKEFDVTLGYSIGGLGIALTDYWWAGESQPYGYYDNTHYLEGALSYNFGESCPLTLSVATMFAGADKKADDADKQNFSTYISASYDFTVGEVSLTPAIGFTPHKSLYSNGKDGAITDISIKASKELKITDSFSLPVFVQAIVAPAYDKTFLVFGVSF
ncbi:hypothetical protein [uncultured Bacteroides sp.]|uniref:hypothetical protein n=1 Tax=uncultured Bacteroides sp. TaxID=162156 RepID=UPI002AA83A1F|nr:hypothetical protein [uncultured Bacteroides sp.]